MQPAGLVIIQSRVISNGNTFEGVEYDHGGYSMISKCTYLHMHRQVRISCSESHVNAWH